MNHFLCLTVSETLFWLPVALNVSKHVCVCVRSSLSEIFASTSLNFC